MLANVYNLRPVAKMPASKKDEDQDETVAAHTKLLSAKDRNASATDLIMATGHRTTPRGTKKTARLAAKAGTRQ